MQRRKAEAGLETKVSAATRHILAYLQQLRSHRDHQRPRQSRGQRSKLSRVLPLQLAAPDQHTLPRVLQLLVVCDDCSKQITLPQAGADAAS